MITERRARSSIRANPTSNAGAQGTGEKKGEEVEKVKSKTDEELFNERLEAQSHSMLMDRLTHFSIRKGNSWGSVSRGWTSK